MKNCGVPRPVVRSSGSIVAVIGGLASGLAFTPATLLGQASDAPADRPIDRWLVAAVAPDGLDGNPLSAGGARLFPDRDLQVGPALWTLVREDGRDRFSFDEVLPDRPAGATATLAHAYLRLPADATASLTVDAACPGAALWLNGQALADASDDGTVVRLAGGWNTLLVALSGEDGCPAELSARVAPADVPRPEDEPALETRVVRVQASRPPGARPTYPLGFVQPGTPTPTGMVWDARNDRLLIELEHSLTAWGATSADAASGEDGEDGDRPEADPAFDLTGVWSLRFFTPTGIRAVEARLEMSEDGTLAGRLEGEGFDGDVRDGWVAGNEFGWNMRFPGPRRDVDVTARGRIEDGRMRGSVDLGVGDFETGFEGTRSGGAEADDTGDEEDEDVQSPAPPRRSPDEGPPGRGARGDITFPGGGPPDRREVLSRLLPPQPWRERPAPTSGSIELDVAGAELTGGTQDLVPTRPSTMSGRIEFRRARSAALESGSVEATVRWNGDDRVFVGQLAPGPLLRALHRPIALTGWTGLADGLAGQFRVPDAFRGFTLRVLGGQWSVGGVPLDGEPLCAPCRGGDRLDLRVTGTDTPRVEIVDPGYPSAGPEAPPARAWLEALRGDNDSYRRMAGRDGG